MKVTKESVKKAKEIGVFKSGFDIEMLLDCPSCGAVLDCASQDKTPSNFYACANCGCIVYRPK